MKQKQKGSTSRQKLSEMIVNVAGEYLAIAETVDERENYLRSACTAWNIACLPPLRREHALRRYCEQYRKTNQADETDSKNFEQDIRLLIDQKERLYPDINVQIVDSMIERINGKDHVTVVSVHR